MQGSGACVTKQDNFSLQMNFFLQQIFSFPLLIKTTNSTKQQQAQQQKHSF